MTQEIRSDVAIKSTTLNRSGLRTTNMTSTTPDHQEGTSWKNVQVDENGNFVVGPSSGGGSSDGNLTFSTTAGLAPTSPTAPAIPPSPVIAGDTHRENYDDKILWWTWNGTSWVLSNTEIVATSSSNSFVFTTWIADGSTQEVVSEFNHNADTYTLTTQTATVLEWTSTSPKKFRIDFDSSERAIKATFNDGTTVYEENYGYTTDGKAYIIDADLNDDLRFFVDSFTNDTNLI